MTLIGDLFGNSPIRPMQKHMKAAVSCAREVEVFFDLLAKGDREGAMESRVKINELEHQADEVKNEIRGHLPKRLFLPVERRDMLEMLDCQDSIADRAQDVVQLIALRNFEFPQGLRDSILPLVKSVIQACEKADQVVNELDELVETGFGNREVSRVEEMIAELNRLESETDELEEQATKKLFELESELGFSAYFWYQIIGWIGDMADFAERVGNRLRLLIAN